MKKKEVRECVRGCQNCVFLYELEGPIDDGIEDLKSIKGSAEALGYKDVEFELPQEMEYEENALHVFGTRIETNEEVENRKKEKRKQKEKRKKEKTKKEERELKEYLRLKEKFGGKTDNEKLL